MGVRPQALQSQALIVDVDGVTDATALEVREKDVRYQGVIPRHIGQLTGVEGPQQNPKCVHVGPHGHLQAGKRVQVGGWGGRD